MTPVAGKKIRIKSIGTVQVLGVSPQGLVARRGSKIFSIPNKDVVGGAGVVGADLPEALNPETSKERLLELLTEGEGRVMANPNVPPVWLSSDVAIGSHLNWVEQNPVLSLYALEDPSLYARLRLLLSENWLNFALRKISPKAQAKLIAEALRIFDRVYKINYPKDNVLLRAAKYIDASDGHLSPNATTKKLIEDLEKAKNLAARMARSTAHELCYSSMRIIEKMASPKHQNALSLAHAIEYHIADGIKAACGIKLSGDYDALGEKLRELFADKAREAFYAEHPEQAYVGGHAPFTMEDNNPTVEQYQLLKTIYPSYAKTFLPIWSLWLLEDPALARKRAKRRSFFMLVGDGSWELLGVKAYFSFLAALVERLLLFYQSDDLDFVPECLRLYGKGEIDAKAVMAAAERVRDVVFRSRDAMLKSKSPQDAFRWLIANSCQDAFSDIKSWRGLPATPGTGVIYFVSQLSVFEDEQFSAEARRAWTKYLSPSAIMDLLRDYIAGRRS